MKELEKRIYYFFNGSIRREFYVNDKGQNHGSDKEWLHNGTLIIYRTHLKGKLHGIYRWWHDNGRIDYTVQLKENNRHGINIEFGY